MSYCFYLRKSRTDLEAEARGEGETLARHEKILLEIAQRQNLPIMKIYREIVSGETIASRPMMQQLLTAVERGEWDGVLVTEVERLARGDTIDQGLVAQTFKASNTKIITPTKTYDPQNEFDEEYFEFGLFMSRREYKTINRRLQSGRAASAKEGKFVGSIAPYGYKRVKLPNEKGYTLEIIDTDAEIVRLIFSLYTEGALKEDGTHKRLGAQMIARKLNTMGVPPIRHDYWQKETVLSILTNPTYAGKIRWGYRRAKKRIISGHTAVSRPISNDDKCIIVNGRHQAIIDESVFDMAQYYLSQIPPSPVGYKNELVNPLAGLIICGKCGRSMVYRKGTGKKVPYIVCHGRACNNVSSSFKLVEAKLMEALKEWLKEYTLTFAHVNTKSQKQLDQVNNMMIRLESDIKKLSNQLSKVHDAFEQGVYDMDQFLDRSQIINQRLETLKTARSKAKDVYENEVKRIEGLKDIYPKVTRLIDAYDKLATPKDKNDMLKQVLEKAAYIKEKSAMYRGVTADSFELTLFPSIPSDYK